MGAIFHDLLEVILTERESFNHIWFAGGTLTAPPFSYQVKFPRLELVLNGEYINQIELADDGIVDVNIAAGDALYIPPMCWNKPNWQTNCSVLSLLFGRRHIGFSLVSKNKHEEGFFDVTKHNIQTRTGHALDHIINALNVLANEPNKAPMDEHLLVALISYSQSIISDLACPAKNRSEDLYQGICLYIQEHFDSAISRSSIANRFNISANHLSRIFRQQGHMTLAHYITWVRIEKAKLMLNNHPYKLSEVATCCGFQDVNYFCRVFKNRTELTPTEYRGML
jgi:AraC-like DNA-binding protein